MPSAERVALDLSFKSPIRQLNENNYSAWIVDVRALLRKQKLWKYTQENPPEALTPAALAKWQESSQDAADTMTPTISDPIKQRLTRDEFNSGFMMLSRLTTLYQPTGDGEFMRLTKEYYTLKFRDFGSISDYLTRIKTLEERILATNVVLTPDKQTIICLSMSLPEDLQYLTKIWDVTPGMTADKARTMLLEEERKRAGKEEDIKVFAGAVVGGNGNRKPCKTCGKMHGAVCWDERPDLAPDWLKEKRQQGGTKRKRTVDDQATEAHAQLAFSF